MASYDYLIGSSIPKNALWINLKFCVLVFSVQKRHKRKENRIVI